MDLANLSEFFLKMTLLNLGIFSLSAILILLIRPLLCRMHSKMFGIEEAQVAVTAYNFLGAYKLFFIVFNLVPLIALKLMQ